MDIEVREIPFKELVADYHGGGEGDLGEAVLGFSVGVSSQLTVVGQP